MLLYPVAKPVALVLDVCLGEEMGYIHSRKELEKMMELHVKHGTVDEEIGRTLSRTLSFCDRTVEDIMTPLHKTFMLHAGEVLDVNTMRTIFKQGFSRVPVYDKARHDVTGLMLVKDLMFVDPGM